MLSGKVNAALRLLSDTESAGILPTTKKTINLLKEKHPVGAPKYHDLLLHGLRIIQRICIWRIKRCPDI